MKREFIKELTTLLNIHGIDNDFNTPDFILTEYIINCLKAFDTATRRRMLHEDNFHSNIEITEIEKPLPKKIKFSACVFQEGVPDYNNNIFTEKALRQMADENPNELFYDEQKKALYAYKPVDSKHLEQILPLKNKIPCSLKEKK